MSATIRPITYEAAPLRPHFAVSSATLRDLRGALDAAARGSVAVLVAGEPGAGHDEAAAEAERLALEYGYPTLRLNATYEPLALGALGRIAEWLEVDREALADGRATLAAVRASLKRRTAERPAVIIVEQIAALPAEDRGVLLGLALDPPPGRHCVLVTDVAPLATGPGAGEDLRRDFERARTGRVLDLEPLSVDDATAYAESVLPAGSAAPRFLRDLVALTAGRASYVADMLEHVLAMPEDDRADVLSGSRPAESLTLPRALAGRLRAPFAAAGEGDVPGAALALALWGAPAAPATLAELLEGDEAGVERDLDRLEVARLVAATRTRGSLAFALREPLTGLAILEGIPTLTRGRLHRRAAEMLEGAPGPRDVHALARHYVGGAVPWTPERLESVAQAAHELVDRSRYAAARELLSEALAGLRSQEPDIERLRATVPPEVIALLAETLSRAGNWKAAAALLSFAAERRTAESLPALLRIARDRLALGGREEALQLYRSLLDGSGNFDERSRARLLVDLGRIERGADAARASDEALEAALASEDWALATEAAIGRHIRLLNSARPLQALVHISSALHYANRSDTRMRCRAISGVGGALADADSLQRGTRWARRAHRLAEQCEDYATVSWTGIRLALAGIELGRWVEAEEVASRVMHIDASLHRVRALPRSRAILNLLHALRGGDGGVLARGAARRPAGGSTEAGSVIDAAANFERLLAEGDATAALEVIRAEHEGSRARGGLERSMLVHTLPRRVRAAVALDDAAELRRALEEMRALVDETGAELRLGPAEVLRAEAELAALEGEGAPAIDRFEAAAEALHAIGYEWRRAMALRRAGEVAAAAGDEERALGLLNTSYTLFQRMGAHRQCAELRRTFASINRRPPALHAGQDVLSEREIEVGRLAAAGESDAAIAEALGISRRTVTTHMRNILRKLQINSRRDLPQRFGDRG